MSQDPHLGQVAAYRSALDQPRYAPPPAAAPVSVAPLPMSAVARHGHRTAVIWLLSLLAFVSIALVGYFVAALGAVASGVGLVLALVPLAIVLTGVRMIDRWEPEPPGLVAFALAWGAVAAIALTLLVDIVLTMQFGARDLTFSAVFQAPIVEEVCKGFGVLLVFVVGRAAFDGPVDGVVYGALVGAGFAFTENIQYFAVSLIEGGGVELTGTFVLRGILSPFAHAMFTALIGFAIGLAARRGRSVSRAMSAGIVGLVGAIALHVFWNGSAIGGDFFPLYVTLQMPLFCAFIVGIIALRREEARLTSLRLGDYARAGWFTAQEVTMLATKDGRRTGLAWAAGLRGGRTETMKSFIRDATELAAVRQRALSGRDRYAQAREAQLLARVTHTRAALLAY